MVRFLVAVFVFFFFVAVFFVFVVVPLKADASKIRKLFTACTGPVGAIPREAWKRMDPTWRIVDERNAIGIVVRTQGPFPRDIFWFSKVCRNPRAIKYLPPLFPRKSEQRPDTCVFFCWRGWMGGQKLDHLEWENFYQAPSPFAIYAQPAFFPRTFAVEQGQKSPQHCTAWRHAESDWPPRFRGSSWGVQTAHDGLDESYGPKDLLLLKKPMFRQCFTPVTSKTWFDRRKRQVVGEGWWFLVVVFRSFARWCKWLEILDASSWGCYACCGRFIFFWGTPLCWLSYHWNFSLSENHQVTGRHSFFYPKIWEIFQATKSSQFIGKILSVKS